MPLQRHLVITLHGVNPDRGWQDRAKEVLEPHFRCESVRYRRYGTRLGPFQVLFNFNVIALAAVGGAMIGVWWRPGLSAVVLLVTMVTSIGIAKWFRYRTVDSVKREISSYAATSIRSPHIIAHSFGTYIVGRALQKFPDLHFGRIVFVGCVLPHAFDWFGLLRDRPDAFHEIRNEVGLSDIIVKLLRWARRIAPDMGTAGVSGFRGTSRLVHATSHPWGPCVPCGDRRALIHNVELADFGHSDWALGPGHARALWLPFLWGYSPLEFKEWLECCQDAAWCRQDGETLWDDLEVAEQKLLSSIWAWTNGRPLAAFLESEIDRMIHKCYAARGVAIRTRMRDVIHDALVLIYVGTVDAFEECAVRDVPRSEDRERVMRSLWPPRAIARAVHEAVVAAE